MKREVHRRLRGFFLFALLALFSGIASAQAWVPEEGETTTSTSYEFIAFGGHFQSDGSRTPQAASRSQSVICEVEYGVTNRLAITASLPIVSARYASTNPPTDVVRALFEEAVQAVGLNYYNHPFLDDLHYHTTLQDFRINARYNLVSAAVLVTPFIGLEIPSHDYAYVGESAPGRNLKEFQFGTDVARRLDPLLRKSYLEGQLSFAIPESALNIRTSRTNASIELGYLLNHKLAFRGFGHWQHTFNGLHFPADLTTPERILTHERLLKANYWHLGGGVSYELTRYTEISADLVTFLAGSDTHYGSGIAFRISHTLRPKPFVGHFGRPKPD